MCAQIMLLLPHSHSKDKASFLVHHPERRRLLPKVTQLNWWRLDGVSRYCVLLVKDHLYFVGGYKHKKRKYSRQMLRYELHTAKWYYCNKMQTARADFEAFAFDGKIYCAGGRTNGDLLTNEVESFEPTTNSWFSENPLPEPCAEFALLRVDSAAAVLLLGGVLPAGSSSAAAAAAAGSIRCSSHMWRFGLLKSTNPYLDFEYRWEALPADIFQLPTSRGLRGHRVLLDADYSRIYIVGGSPFANKQQLQAAMPAALAAAAKLPGIFYCSLLQLCAVLDAWDKSNNTLGEPVQWNRRQVAQCRRSNAAVSLIGDKLFVLGGTAVTPGPPAAAVVEPAVAADVDDGDVDGPKDSILETRGEVVGDGEQSQEKQQEAAEDAAAAATAPEAGGELKDAGFYDRRRKAFQPLFSIDNCGFSVGNVSSVTFVPAAKGSKDFRQDRLDWLLQWALW